MRKTPSLHAESTGPKYRNVFERLSHDILTGKYKPGQRLPSEAALVRQFETSRITIGRAVRELKDKGLVDRIAGSGTYVRMRPAGDDGAVFGLLIPDLGTTEIFEPICQGMASAPEASHHALLWGRTESARATKEEQALELAHQYIQRRVSGVFFAPLEPTPGKDETNLNIIRELEKARIPIVLLDRSPVPFPQRSGHDLVGIDNRRAGYLITEHLLKLGCRRMVFIAHPQGAPTVEARIAGFRDALSAHKVPVKSDSIQRLNSITKGEMHRIIKNTRPDAFVCVNDQVAGSVMRAVLEMDYKVPSDVRIVGIDDVGYAKLLPVPLTTVHQPCREIGEAAMAAMLKRIENPEMLPRDILLDCELIVRESCGAQTVSKSK